MNEIKIILLIVDIFLTVVVNNEFEKRIVEAFEIFDHTGNKTIDVREVASVLCSLGKKY